MSILALDLATKTGWAHADGASGVFAMPKLDAGDHSGWRFDAFASWLADTLANHKSSAIVYEQAHHRGGPPTRLALGLIGVMQLVAAREGIEVVKPFHTATIKKHATGKGNAKKPEMLTAAKIRNPDRDFIDDNEIDALFLLDLALNDRELPAADAARG